MRIEELNRLNGLLDRAHKCAAESERTNAPAVEVLPAHTIVEVNGNLVRITQPVTVVPA